MPFTRPSFTEGVSDRRGDRRVRASAVPLFALTRGPVGRLFTRSSFSRYDPPRRGPRREGGTEGDGWTRDQGAGVTGEWKWSWSAFVSRLTPHAFGLSLRTFPFRSHYALRLLTDIFTLEFPLSFVLCLSLPHSLLPSLPLLSSLYAHHLRGAAGSDERSEERYAIGDGGRQWRERSGRTTWVTTDRSEKGTETHPIPSASRARFARHRFTVGRSVLLSLRSLRLRRPPGFALRNEWSECRKRAAETWKGA